MSIQLSDHFTYKKLLRFTLPSVAMMVFTSIYGVVDGFFVSNIFSTKSCFFIHHHIQLTIYVTRSLIVCPSGINI